jgi:hypothetical protein
MNGNYRAVIILSILFLLICIFIVFIIYLNNSKRNSNVTQPYSQVNNTQVTTSQPESTGSSINICQNQHSGYPQLKDLLSTPAYPSDRTFYGSIKSIDSKDSSIEVISSTGGDSFLFTSGSIDGKTYDIHNKRVFDLNTIPTNEKAMVTFPCDQSNGSFTINRFQLIKSS